MHNIGRTVDETSHEYEGHEFEGQEFEGQEFEGHEFEDEYEGHEFEGHEFEGAHEYEGHEFEGGHEMEMEDEFLNELHEMHEAHGETAHEMHEAMEMELASELLEVGNEQELEQFLGGLIGKAAGAIKGFANSAAGKKLGGFLKSAAKKALPIAGSALGNFFVPGLGGVVGKGLGTLASNMFELELEGLSNEDKEFEMSRAFVRFASNAARRAASNPHFRTRPRLVARNATIGAARQFAPGLLRKGTGLQRSGARGFRQGARSPRLAGRPRGRYSPGQSPYPGDPALDGMDGDQPATTGTWYQQGDQIILNLA